jgi:hypothetical protein
VWFEQRRSQVVIATVLVRVMIIGPDERGR